MLALYGNYSPWQHQSVSTVTLAKPFPWLHQLAYSVAGLLPTMFMYYRQLSFFLLGLYLFIFIYICVYVCIYVCVCVCRYIYMYVYVCIYIYVFICICMWVCVYTYLTILAFFIFALNVISCLYITNFMFCYIIIISFVFPEIIVLQETSHMLALRKLGPRPFPWLRQLGAPRRSPAACEVHMPLSSCHLGDFLNRIFWATF